MANPYGRYGKVGAYFDFILISIIVITLAPFLIFEFISFLFEDGYYFWGIVCILALLSPIIICGIVKIVKYKQQDKTYTIKYKNESDVYSLIKKIKKNDTPNEISSLFDLMKNNAGIVFYDTDNNPICTNKDEQKFINYHANTSTVKNTRYRSENKTLNDFFDLKIFDNYGGIRFIYKDQCVFLYKKHFEHYISNSLTALLNKYDESEKCLGNYKVNIYSNKMEIYHQTDKDTSAIISPEILVKQMNTVIYKKKYLNIEFEIQDKAIKKEYSNLIDGFIYFSKNYYFGSPSSHGNFNYKTHAGTTKILSLAELGEMNYKKFRTNIQLFLLDFHHKAYVYSPGIIFVVKENRIIKYNEISYTLQPHNVVCENTLDSRVVGKQWKYSNRNGTPDRRYKNNYSIPVCEYGIVKAFYKSKNEYNLAGSSFAKMKEFYEAVVSYSKIVNNL